MYNANPIFKTFYYTAIKNAIDGVGVFKDYVPNELNTDTYFLISNVQNTDHSSVNKHDVKAFVTIGIYTRSSVENSGATMQQMADALFSLYPTPQSYPEIEGYQVCSMDVESDNELSVSLDSGNVYLNRQIIFSHILNKLN
jgi:hypothetical protein